MKVTTVLIPDLWGSESYMKIVQPRKRGLALFAVCGSWTTHLQAVKSSATGAALCGRKPPVYAGTQYAWEWMGDGDVPKAGTTVCRTCAAIAKKRQAKA